MPNNPISTPAGHVPARAIGFSSAGNLVLVDAASPLPVQTVSGLQPAPQALTGSTATSLLAGPFTPAAARAVVVTLTGDWTGTVTVERSIDAGITRHPLTIAGQSWGRFTANACEPVWSEEEAGASLYLSIALTGGTLDYRLAQ